MKSVGEKLRHERLQRGMDLQELASRTRINLKYLEAIESNNTAELPGGFFYRSFVRQYANALGLDGAALEAELEAERQREAPVLSASLKRENFPVKPPDPIVSRANNKGKASWTVYLSLLAAVLVGCTLLYNWWHRVELTRAERSQEVPLEPPPPPAQIKPYIQPPPLTQPAPEQAAQQPVADPAAAAAKTPAVSPEDKVVIKIAATDVTWVAIAADGKTIYSGTLQPQQEIVLGGKERAVITVGNAGGLALSWNGKAIGPVGARGQVRSVVLTPESYRIADGAL